MMRMGQGTSCHSSSHILIANFPWIVSLPTNNVQHALVLLVKAMGIKVSS